MATHKGLHFVGLALTKACEYGMFTPGSEDYVEDMVVSCVVLDLFIIKILLCHLEKLIVAVVERLYGRGEDRT
jgi:hypothetical protein